MFSKYLPVLFNKIIPKIINIKDKIDKYKNRIGISKAPDDCRYKIVNIIMNIIKIISWTLSAIIVPIKIEKLVTENNDLYGSVKPTEIAKIIKEKHNLSIQPSQIDLEKEIKSIGSFKTTINLHSEIQANILIEVEKSEEKKS